MTPSPKLSVNMITYNHADYIARALDSVLMQKVAFPYEIIVGDDCSSDKTPEIIETYHRRYPEIIKPILRTKNVGMGRNITDTLGRCNGDYIACLEGDDYWTDPEKAQLQVDYLDRHQDCAICHHRVEHISWPQQQILREYPPKRYRVESLEPRELAIFNCVQTCSVMFRRKWLPQFDSEYEALKLGDWPLFVLLAERGWIGYLDRTMAHYRVHSSNTWNDRPADYKLRAMERMAWYLLEKVNEGSKDHWRDTILALSFKDVVLATKSMSLMRAGERLNHFIKCALKFRKPFWVFTRLWPYLRAYYFAK